MRYYYQTFTVTVADPAVFTCTDHDLSIGDAIILSTTDALPTGLTADTAEYYVVRKGYSSSTFQLSDWDTPEGTGDSIITTGTQSGTHSFLKVNRNKISTMSTPFR
jgi:hypothetical protein